MGWEAASSIIRMVNRLAASLGAEVVRSNPAARAQLVRERRITVVMDVGAHHGGYGRRLRKAGFRGRIVSLEPHSAAYETLVQVARPDPEWECRRLALAEQSGQANLRLAGRDQASSLLELDPDHVARNPEWFYVGEEEVEVRSLDSLREELLRPDDRVLLKLDTQGSELAILRGGVDTMEQVHAIEAELSLQAIYRDQPLLPEVLAFLQEQGFQLVWLERILVDRSSSYLLQIDALFGKVETRRETAPSRPKLVL